MLKCGATHDRYDTDLNSKVCVAYAWIDTYQTALVIHQGVADWHLCGMVMFDLVIDIIKNFMA